MFNLFKKKVIKEEVKEIEPEINIEDLVLEIQNEFDSANEKLVKEVQLLVTHERCMNDNSKGELLSSLGFISSEAAVAANHCKIKNTKNQELLDAINYFKKHYPNNKFITETVLRDICGNYNLYCGSSSDFKGDISDDKLKIISKFKLRVADQTKVVYKYYKKILDKNCREKLIECDKKESTFYGYYGVKEGIFDTFYSYIEIKDKSKTHHYTKPEFKVCTLSNIFYYSPSTKNIPTSIILQPVTYKDIIGYLIISI
jgi:hypothetical protein